MGFGDFIKSAAGGDIIGSAIGAVGSLIGGGMKNNAAEAQAALQYQNQKEFAQNGIRWKVADAKAAGIHPLAALGAQTVSYNPVSIQASDGGVSEALGRMGQGISRAAEAKQIQEERAANEVIRGLQIEGLKLDNKRKQQDIDAEYTRQAYALADRIAATQQQPPPMPIVNDSGKGGPPSSKAGVQPFWEHFRNFDWLTPVPSGDLKDYVSENMLISLASQLAYAQSAWSGKVRPDDSALTGRERARIKAGLASPMYYPFLGWRVDPTVKHMLLNSVPLLRPAILPRILKNLRGR